MNTPRNEMHPGLFDYVYTDPARAPDGGSIEDSLDDLPRRDRPTTAILETPAVTGTAVVKDRLRTAIPTATVKLYVRHSKGCPKRSDKYYRHCQCPKWIYENYATDRRYSARTRSWGKAENRRQEIEDSHDPVKAELKRLKETQQAKRIMIPDAVERCLQDARARNLARTTQRGYRRLSNKLLAWSEQNGLGYVDELTTAQLTKWRSTWPVASLTAQVQQGLLGTVFEFFVRQDWLAQNPVRRLTRIQVKLPQADYFPPVEFDRLVRASYSFGRGSGNWKNANWSIRLRTLLLLMRWSGLRISDATTLARSQLVGDNIFLRQAKTGTDVFVPLPHYVAEALSEIPPGPAPNPGYFFWSGNGAKQTIVSRWSHAFRRLFQIADIRKPDGTPKWCHPHMLRHTFAIELLRAGVDIRKVSVLLGHASVRITERFYAPWVPALQEQLEETIKKAHRIQGITKSVAKGVNVDECDSETLPLFQLSSKRETVPKKTASRNRKAGTAIRVPTLIKATG
jgi:integrase/recombinase XerD